MYLESIESDNYKPLPGGIFNKGFVKSYAKYVGLDEQEALQEYARLVAQNEETIEDSHPRYRPEVLTDDARSASSIVTTVVFAAIILALMTVGILFAVNYIRTNQAVRPLFQIHRATPRATRLTLPCRERIRMRIRSRTGFASSSKPVRKDSGHRRQSTATSRRMK
jgi:cytoskeletal protein RodZ